MQYIPIDIARPGSGGSGILFPPLALIYRRAGPGGAPIHVTVCPNRPAAHTRRRARWRGAAGLAAALALAGCQPPSGPVPAASTAPPAIPGPPPTAMQSPPPLPAGPAAWDGEYAGEGRLEVGLPGQLDCPRRVSVTGMTVRDGRAQFGRYRGRVRPDGSVRMAFRSSLITGRLTDDGFTGTLSRPYPGCRYRLALSRVATS